jgi:GTPase involved in cell partitioning and DNA repair
MDDFAVLRRELMSYDPGLLDRRSCIVLNKCDVDGAEELVKTFREQVEHPYIMEISAKEDQGLEDLKVIIEALG